MLPRASENTELHDEISSWKNKFKGTQGDLDDLKAVLSRKDREIFRLENELASQTAGLQSLRKESGLAHSNVDTVEINQMLRQREEDLMEKLKTAQSEVATLQSELTASERKCRELEEDLMESRSQTDRIAGKEKKNFETVSKLEVSVVELEQKNSALHRELNEVSIKGTLMASSDMLKSKSLEMELEHLRIELDSIRNIKMHPVNSVPTPVTIEYQHATKNCIDSTEFVDLRRAHDYLAVELGTSKMVF